MSRRFAALGVAASVVLAATPAAAQAPGRTLTFKERNKGATFKFIDNPPRAKRGRPTAGDMFVFSNPVVSATGARRGTLRATCTFASTRAAVCYGAFSLKEGQLTAVVSTDNLDARTTRGAIVGGTGVYAGARGTFNSTTTKTGSDDTVTLAG
jgi:hypothetical protein